MRPVLLQESPCCAAKLKTDSPTDLLRRLTEQQRQLVAEPPLRPDDRAGSAAVGGSFPPGGESPGAQLQVCPPRSHKNARRASIKMLQAIARRHRRHGNSGSAITPARRASGHGRPTRSFVPRTSGSPYRQQRGHIASRALIGPPFYRAEANQCRRQPICAPRLGPLAGGNHLLKPGRAIPELARREPQLPAVGALG